MTRREEAQEFLKGQLVRLKEVHVEDLMRARRHEELEAILEDIELDISPLETFWDEEDEAIYQSEQEIPKEFLYELVCYMSCSEYDDDYYCEAYGYLQNVLRATKEEVLLHVADIMDERDLCMCNFKQLVA